MFDPVDPKQAFPDLERGILRYWQEEDIFKRSIAARTKKDSDPLDEAAEPIESSFSFFDGPPFATGLPHYGHLLAGTIKDVIPRYQTMQGKRVQRRFGWDCHGLPVEYEIEKEQGLSGRQDIEKMGIKAFNDLCRAAVQRYTKEWRKAVERMGRWVDMDWDYKTMDPDYMESIWWVFKSLHEKGLLYEGHKPMHICPRCETPLSNFEVTQGYKEITDLSVTVKFELAPTPAGRGEKTYILAWTTTPWTLPGNLFLAVHPDIEYVEFENVQTKEKFIAAKKFVDDLIAKDATEEQPTFAIASDKTIRGKDLIGLSYRPLFSYFSDKYKEKAFRIVEGGFVATEEGTGVVHIAPGFGEDDYNVGKREGVKILQHIRTNGTFISEVKDFAGMEAKPKDDPTKTDRIIVEFLKKKERVFDSKSYPHSYPHCWRCDSPLLNYATSSWFVSIEKIKETMLQVNTETEWVPAHLRDGRFGKWLEGARDWAISRNRYWGTPLPIWRCQETGQIEVLGSRDDLMKKSGERFTKVTILRHGESEGNLKPIYQGKVPGTNLTARGKKQAKRTADSLKEEDVAIIYTSPLARTQQTAGIIAEETDANVVTDERLREVEFGEYEGRFVDFSDLNFVKARRAHKLETNQVESIYHFPGMETWNDVHVRVTSFLQEILPKHKGEHIVIVTHADPLLNMKHYFHDDDPRKLYHQPYPTFADPVTFYFDHETGREMDLHKENIDNITWDCENPENHSKDEPGPLFRRIPDVLDCWFESGSMPYAQSHYPFLHRQDGNLVPRKTTKPLPPGFPADFIAEGIDQTRGWFYTLTVLSSALFEKPAFRHCIVNGIVLAEDGKKMSKRLKNYPEPLEIVEKYGADAIRFTLMSSPAVRGEDLRFSSKLVEESLRSVLLPLWNAYSFFVTYANAAKWEPKETRAHSSHPLDIWIRTETQDLVNRMTEQLENYDLSATCAELSGTIDALTNWYVRLSRRRFAGKGAINEKEVKLDGNEREDQEAAIATLYDVLLTLSQLLAPFCPFVTDAMYLNLVADDHGSIHLTDWPESRKLKASEKKLLIKTRLLRTVVSLGLKVRAAKKIKTRQPLPKVTIAIPPSLLSEPFTEEEIMLISEELNVKEVEIVEDPGALASKVALVDARKVGPRLGARVQEVIVAGKRGDFTEEENGEILILDVTLSPEEAKVVYVGKEGFDVAADRGVVVSMDTAITFELKCEGEARDLMRMIQQARKDAGLEINDKIKLTIEGAEDALKQCSEMIAEETNATFEENDGQAHEVELNGKPVKFRFVKI